MSVQPFDPGLGGVSGLSHVCQGSLAHNAVYPLCLERLSLMGQRKLLTLFGKRSTGLGSGIKRGHCG
jgi:hypothetical protein